MGRAEGREEGRHALVRRMLISKSACRWYQRITPRRQGFFPSWLRVREVRTPHPRSRKTPRGYEDQQKSRSMLAVELREPRWEAA
jgi:hypothetical protein